MEETIKLWLDGVFLLCLGDAKLEAVTFSAKTNLTDLYVSFKLRRNVK